MTDFQEISAADPRVKKAVIAGATTVFAASFAAAVPAQVDMLAKGGIDAPLAFAGPLASDGLGIVLALSIAHDRARGKRAIAKRVALGAVTVFNASMQWIHAWPASQGADDVMRIAATTFVALLPVFALIAFEVATGTAFKTTSRRATRRRAASTSRQPLREELVPTNSATISSTRRPTSPVDSATSRPTSSATRATGPATNRPLMSLDEAVARRLAGERGYGIQSIMTKTGVKRAAVEARIAELQNERREVAAV